jgi:hypothetical protein
VADVSDGVGRGIDAVTQVIDGEKSGIDGVRRVIHDVAEVMHAGSSDSVAPSWGNDGGWRVVEERRDFRRSAPR